MTTQSREYGCSGKVRFASHALAATAARRTPHGRNVPRVPYHCRFCNGYHVGTTIRRPRKPEVERE